MLVPEVIKHAVAGNLHFNFIETTITAKNQGNLSSLKGRGHARPDDGHFHYKFIPRCPLMKEWTDPSGFLQQDPLESGIRFSIKGTERDSAHWSAKADSLRLARSSSGIVIRGNVREWCSFDTRAVGASFMRAIVPGKNLYPVSSQTVAGTRARHASVDVDDMRVEFRDYGQYTEIFAQDSGELPRGLADKAVDALAGVLKQPVELVYKEEHFNAQRHVCVRQANPQTHCPTEDGESTAVENYGAFWNRYSAELSRLCATPVDDAEACQTRSSSSAP